MDQPELTPKQEEEAAVKRKVAVIWLRKLIETTEPPPLFAAEVGNLVPRLRDLLLKLEKKDELVNAEEYKCPACSSKTFLNLTKKKCPKCGLGLALRQNRVNGNYFLGCKAWPSCSGSANLGSLLAEANRDLEAEAEKRRKRKAKKEANDFLRPGEELRRINL